MGSQFFLFLNYYSDENKKQKLYLLKNDILLSDLRYYHRLKNRQTKNKQLTVCKQTAIVNKTKLNKHYFDDKKLIQILCATFCFETPLPLDPPQQPKPQKIPLL